MNQNEETMLGAIIDLPYEEFKVKLEEQKVNIGIMNNIILSMESAYYELKLRKERILVLIFKGIRDREDPEVKKALEGLYAEMTKIELKVTYLKQRVGELLNVDKTPN